MNSDIENSSLEHHNDATNDNISFQQSLSKAFSDPRLKVIINKAIAQGLGNGLTAVHLIGNSMLMSSVSPTATAASSVVATLQSVVMSASVGFGSSAGTRLGAAIGSDRNTNDAEKNETVSSLIKVAWFNSVVVGAAFSGIFFSTKYVMPYFLEEDVANCVWDFFKYTTWSPMAYILIHMNGLIILQVEQDANAQLIAAACYRIPSLILGYILAHPMKMGVTGIGLASTIPAWVVCVAMYGRFLRERYAVYQLQNICHIKSFCKHFNDFFSEGWKLALQRITEWINLFCISMAIGQLDRGSLVPEGPSINAMILFNLFTQGLTQAGMMEVAPLGRELENIKNDPTQKSRYFVLRQDIHNIFLLNNMLGIISNAIAIGFLLLFKERIINLYLGSDVTSDIRNLSAFFLMINSISLLPDSVRHISGGILRGWGDLLYPTLVSLYVMTGLGVPIGVAVGYYYKNEYAESLFMLRLITITLSSILTYKRFYHFHKNPNSFMQHNRIEAEAPKMTEHRLLVDGHTHSLFSHRSKEHISSEYTPLVYDSSSSQFGAT
jgi:Na+-driven multidrug efflux pump